MSKLNMCQMRSALLEIRHIQGQVVMYPQYVVFGNDNDAELENFQTSPYAGNDPRTIVINSAEDAETIAEWLESETQ